MRAVSPTVSPRRATWAASLLAAAVVGVLAAPVAVAAPACDDTCRIRGAQAYVAALVSHDASRVPLAPDATRVEAGLPTGFSGPQIRFDLDHGPQYHVIRAVRDERYTVRDGVVVADYTLDVGLGPVPVTTARIHETFGEDAAGALRRIVADVTVPAGR